MESKVTQTILTSGSEQILPALHLACGDDELRQNMLLIEIKNNCATATNGHLMVRVDLNLAEFLTPEMVEMMNGRFIHKEVWKEIHKCQQLKLVDDAIICVNKGIEKRFSYSSSQGEFFDIDTLIKSTVIDGPEAKDVVCYTPSLINIIAKAFKTDQLHFSFSVGSHGTFVYPFNGCGMFAILMPRVLVDGQNVHDRYYIL